MMDFTTTVFELVSTVSLQIFVERMSKFISSINSKVKSNESRSNYPIGAKSFKFAIFISGTSFICIEDMVLFV